MGIGLRSILGATAIGALALAAPGATGTTTHTYPVSISIHVDRAEKRIRGEVTSPAPSEFCTESTVRIMHAVRGKDELVTTVRPGAGRWGLKIRPKRSGDRLYAQTLQYHLPSRPVVCLAARSKAVTAP